MLLLDLSHTSHSPARTGVQRVALELRKALRGQTALQEITHDPHAQTWRPLQSWETDSLDRPALPANKRGTTWPLRAQLRGWWQRRRIPSGPISGLPAQTKGIVFPEVFTARTAAHLPALFSAIQGPKVAVFHDAIALRLPELSPPGTVARFPAYLEELRDFDGIAAVSEDSRQSLIDYWNWAGWGDGPEVITLPLGCDHLAIAPAENSLPSPHSPLKILSVGSLEGRKNHITLLNACEKLWASGSEFELELVGGLQRETGVTAFRRIRELQSAGRPLIHHGWLSDASLLQAFRSSAFTVYPSIMEGFGLPVWESLLQGKPCVCSSFGAVAETARDGGCLPTDTRDVDALAGAIAILLTNSVKRDELTAEARLRKPNSWGNYAYKLSTWMYSLPSNPSRS